MQSLNDLLNNNIIQQNNGVCTKENIAMDVFCFCTIVFTSFLCEI